MLGGIDGYIDFGGVVTTVAIRDGVGEFVMTNIVIIRLVIETSVRPLNDNAIVGLCKTNDVQDVEIRILIIS